MAKIQITENDIKVITRMVVENIMKTEDYDTWRTGQYDPSAPFNQKSEPDYISIDYDKWPRNEEGDFDETLYRNIKSLGCEIEEDYYGAYGILGPEDCLDKVAELLDSLGVEYNCVNN